MPVGYMLNIKLSCRDPRRVYPTSVGLFFSALVCISNCTDARHIIFRKYRHGDEVLKRHMQIFGDTTMFPTKRS